MNAEQLRAMQAPIKAKYKEQPETARAILRAEGRLGLDRPVCLIPTNAGLIEAGLHPATGGTGKDECSADMLLQALIGCAGVTLSVVATALGIALRGGKVIAEGTLDFRGTLGVSKEVPVGFEGIKLRFELDADATPEQADNLIRLTERYCVVFQTLKNPPNFVVEKAIIANEG